MVQQFFRRLPHGGVGARAVERREHCFGSAPVSVRSLPVQREQIGRCQLTKLRGGFLHVLGSAILLDFCRLRQIAPRRLQIAFIERLGRRLLRALQAVVLGIQRLDPTTQRPVVRNEPVDPSDDRVERGVLVQFDEPADLLTDRLERDVCAAIQPCKHGGKPRLHFLFNAFQLRESFRNRPAKFDRDIERQESGIVAIILRGAQCALDNFAGELPGERFWFAWRRSNELGVMIAQPIRNLTCRDHRIAFVIPPAFGRRCRQLLAGHHDGRQPARHRRIGERHCVAPFLRVLPMVPIAQDLLLQPPENVRLVQPGFAKPLTDAHEQARATDHRARRQASVERRQRTRPHPDTDRGQRLDTVECQWHSTRPS